MSTLAEYITWHQNILNRYISLDSQKIGKKVVGTVVMNTPAT